MAEYQRTVGTPVKFTATTNGIDYRWTINGVFQTSELSFTKTFEHLGIYTVEFTAYNDCGDQCVQVIRLSIVSQEIFPSVITMGDYKISDYMSEIKITETPIFTRKSSTEERLPETTDKLLQRVVDLQKVVSTIVKSKVNYNTHYFLETSDTSRRKFDIIQSLGVPATDLYVISEGGGFTLEINDEGYAMTPRTGFNIVDETIKVIWVTGSGTSGTGRIRVGAWR